MVGVKHVRHWKTVRASHGDADCVAPLLVEVDRFVAFLILILEGSVSLGGLVKRPHDYMQ